MPKANLEMEENVEVAGEVYALNDHVYLSAPWNASDGAPWLIGRIMEFIREPTQAISSQSSGGNNPANKKKRKSSLRNPVIIQVKIAHYHRQRDLMSRHILDCRLLEASMTFDIFSISRLRGKCRVEYKAPGEDLDQLKNTPDCFYFHQVYGRYTHRHYDMIPTENVKNAPPEVIQHLRSQYSYVFAEAGMGPQLGDERRGCVSCQKWTTGADSVTCALCSRAYHFTCLNPPLARKPERGYTWACAPCSKQRQDKIEDNLCKGIDPLGSASGSGRTLRDKGKKKETSVATSVHTGKESTGTLRTVDGWPFRYYGQYTEPHSVLDPFDSPFLYTAPRLGPRFQTNVPDDPSARFIPFVIPANRMGRPCKGEKRARDGTLAHGPILAPEVEITRGGDDTIDVISTPEQFVEENQSGPSTLSKGINTVEQYIACVTNLPLYKNVGVSLIDRALVIQRESTSYEEAFDTVKRLCTKSLGFVGWSESESHRMDQAIQDLGEDLRGMVKHFPKKRSFDIARFYYMFKGQKFPEASAHDSRVAASTSEMPDENLMILPLPSPKRPYVCVVCETRVSTNWRKCPDALMAGAAQAKKCVCNDCHSRWRRYGLHHVSPAQHEDGKSKERRARGPTKQNKAPIADKSAVENTPAALVQPSPPPSCKATLPSPPPVSFHLPLTNCVLCQQKEPRAELAQCQNCTLCCHRACGGLEHDADLENWSCLLCKSVGSKTLPKIPSCSLCPGTQPIQSVDDPLTALDIWKVSEYNTFVHMLCAQWHSELVFSDTSTYERVEGFTTIPPNKRKKGCEICQRSNTGACVKCDGCNKHIHVSCAWAAGYKFGYEMQPPRRKRNRELESVKFKEREGILEPKIWCQAHFPARDRVIYGFADRDDTTNLTALQTYSTNFKTTGLSPSIAILRKARRLDAVLASVLTSKHPLDMTGKGVDQGDEYMTGSLGVLASKPSVLLPVIKPTLTAPLRQRRKAGNQPVEHLSRGTSRIRGRGRCRAKSRVKGKGRSRDSSRTSAIPQDPRKEYGGGQGEDDEEEDEEVQDETARPDLIPTADLGQQSVPNSGSKNAIVQKDSPPSVSLKPLHCSVSSLPPVASSSRLELIGASSEIFDASRCKIRQPQSPVLSLHSANSVNPLYESQQPEQVCSGDLRGRQFTATPPTQHHSFPSPTLTTLKLTALPKPASKLRLTLKPAALSSTPPTRPTIVEPEPLPKESIQVPSIPAFPYSCPSSQPVYMPHPARPVSSVSSRPSNSSKPLVTRLPSINQLDSFHPTLPRLHTLSTITPPAMVLPPTAPSGIAIRGKSPALLGSGSFRPPCLINPPHLAFNSTPVNPMRPAAPLMNAPSFDAFAAAAAAHTTKNSSNKSAGSQPGPNVNATSSHTKVELSPARLLNKAIHLS